MPIFCDSVSCRTVRRWLSKNKPVAVIDNSAFWLG